MQDRYKLIVVLIQLLLFCCYPVAAQNGLKKIQTPEELNPGLRHLLALVSPEKNVLPDAALIASILDFISTDKEKNALYYTSILAGIPSAYYEFDTKAGLEEILHYAYNPKIPSVAFSPSSIRLAHWTEVNGKKQPLPNLWELLEGLDAPQAMTVITGIERVENTPDLFSGAYFGYDQYRTLVLMTHQGKRIFISLMKQKDISEVGKKGIVLGEDEDWNYLYTDKSGVTKSGLGWVRPYIYDAYCIMAYIESDDGLMTRCGVFKWIRAGWAGINMVKKKHIYTGIERFANTFNQIVENPKLPDPARLVGSFSRLSAIPTSKLKELTQEQLQALKIQYAEESDLNDFLKDESYVEQLSRLEMESLLAKEYIKAIMINGDDPDTFQQLEGAGNSPEQETLTE